MDWFGIHGDEHGWASCARDGVLWPLEGLHDSEGAVTVEATILAELIELDTALAGPVFADTREVLTSRRAALTWALGLIESEPQPDAWTKCSVTPVPRTVVSETRPAWIEVWLKSCAGSQCPRHLEPIGPFSGNEWRYADASDYFRIPVAWRFVSMPEVANG